MRTRTSDSNAVAVSVLVPLLGAGVAAAAASAHTPSPNRFPAQCPDVAATMPRNGLQVPEAQAHRLNPVERGDDQAVVVMAPIAGH
jgi:hypothetical protein